MGMRADEFAQQRFKTMRIWITNTVEDQAWQGVGLGSVNFDYPLNKDATYRVKIEGRLLDDDDDLDKDDAEEGDKGADDGDKMETDAPAGDKGKEIEAKPEAKPQAHSRFSHFFKAMTVDFQGARMRSGAEQSVDWKKPARTAANANDSALDFDELTFTRSGDGNANVTIQLFRDENPERFLVSDALADIVDETVATRADAVNSVWEYIQLMGLQEDEEKRQFRCDELLKKVRTSLTPINSQHPS